MTESAELRNELIDGVLWLTIDRPDAQNALTTEVRDALANHFEDASANLNVRCIVLTGTGDKAFCAGADLRSPPHPGAAS